MNPVPIVIPLHGKGGKFRDNTELRYALRGIEKHLQGNYRIVGIGPKRPAWLQGVEWIQQTHGRLKTALVMAAEAFPEGFFWWYDDSVPIAPQTLSEIRVTPARARFGKAQTKWGVSLEQIRQRLEQEGIPPVDFSRPHGPYWFDKGMIDEAFTDWPGMKGKFPFETWILSKRRWPYRCGVDAQYYGEFNRAPEPGKIFLNWCDAGFTPQLRTWLDAEFPDPSRFEPQPIPRSNIQVHTIRFGAPWWLSLCAPTLDAWCDRHGHKLKVWGTDMINPEYPDPKFCEIDMLREFVASESEWLLYVDSDVYVDPDAPAQPDLTPGFWIREDLPGGGPRDFKRWLYRNNKSAKDWTYRNAGVWMCDRASASKLLETIAPPYIRGCMEQHQWNWWLAEAASQGLTVNTLPAAWNAWAFESGKGAFYHIAGKKKSIRLGMFRADGRIPNDPPPPPPAPAASGRTSMSMDDRHVQLLHAAAVSDWQGSRIAVEVGAYKGKTTAVLIEALNAGKLEHLHVVEVKPLTELMEVIGAAADPSRVTLHTQPSWDIPLERADFVFIDGDHKWPALADGLRALTWGAKVICMHDSASWPRLPGCWGAWNLGKMLKQAPGRTWEEDCEDRPGEETFRGFLISRAMEPA